VALVGVLACGQSETLALWDQWILAMGAQARNVLNVELVENERSRFNQSAKR